MSRPAIELDDVSISFGSMQVLKDVTVSLEEGEFFPIIKSS